MGFISTWKWAGLVTHFTQGQVAELTRCDLQVYGGKGETVAIWLFLLRAFPFLFIFKWPYIIHLIILILYHNKNFNKF